MGRVEQRRLGEWELAPEITRSAGELVVRRFAIMPDDQPVLDISETVALDSLLELEEPGTEPCSVRFRVDTLLDKDPGLIEIHGDNEDARPRGTAQKNPDSTVTVNLSLAVILEFINGPALAVRTESCLNQYAVHELKHAADLSNPLVMAQHNSYLEMLDSRTIVGETELESNYPPGTNVVIDPNNLPKVITRKQYYAAKLYYSPLEARAYAAQANSDPHRPIIRFLCETKQNTN